MFWFSAFFSDFLICRSRSIEILRDLGGVDVAVGEAVAPVEFLFVEAVGSRKRGGFTLYLIEITLEEEGEEEEDEIGKDWVPTSVFCR